MFLVKLKAILCSVSLALLCTSQAQYASKWPAAPHALKDVAANLLSDPHVLVEIHATNEQMMRAALRTYVDRIRMFKKGQDASQSESDEDYSKLFESGPWGGSGASMSVDDLSSTQRRRLDEIALQQCLVPALLTDEIGLALGITPTQKKKIDSLYSDFGIYWTNLVLNSPEAKADATALQKLSPKSVDSNSQDNTEWSAAQVNAVLDKIVEIYPKLMSRLSSQSQARSTSTEAAARRVLTASQLKQLHRMQGKAFKD